MHLSRLKIREFRNLKDFEIRFSRYDESEDIEKKIEFKSHAVIGQNGSGKSNLIEALIIIFRDLDLNNPASLDYKMDYVIREHNIEIMAVVGRKPKIVIDGEKISAKELSDNANTYLPSHVFAYYSGRNERIEKLFTPHQVKFEKLLREGKDDLMRRLFYCRAGHSQLVLLACLLSEDKVFKKILNDLGVIELDSALFVIKQPHFLKSKTLNDEDIQKGDKRFWYARGTVVNNFLDKLWETCGGAH